MELEKRRQVMLILVEGLTAELQSLDERVAEVESHGSP